MIFDNQVKCIKQNISAHIHTKNQVDLSRRNVLASYFSADISNNLIGGNFYMGFMLLIYPDDSFINLISIMGVLGNLLQIFSPLLLEKLVRRKPILIAGRSAVYVLNIGVIGLVPLFGKTIEVKVAATLIAVFFVNLIGALLAPGYSVWQIKSVPEKMRASFFSIYRIATGIITYIFVLAAGGVVDSFKTTGRELYGLLILRIAATVFCILDVCFLLKIKEYPEPSYANKTNLLNVFSNPFKEKKYLMTVAIACLWSLSANIPGPYFSIYLLKDLKVSYSYLNFVSFFNLPVLILLTPVWARLINRTTWFKVLLMSVGAYSLTYFGLMFVTGKTLYIYLLSTIYSYIMGAGINLVFANLAFINLPKENQTNFIGFYSAMNNFAAFLGIMLGRLFMQGTDGIGIHIMGFAMINKQYLLLLTAIVMIFCTMGIFLLQKKAEPMGESA